jgi:hypothetical protein
MQAPVVEIYVVWHPKDPAGKLVADTVVRHFYGGRFTGLVSGALEVYVRFAPLAGANGVPRPIPVPTMASAAGLETASPVRS